MLRQFGLRGDWFSWQIMAALLALLLCQSGLAATLSSFSPSFGQPGDVITIIGSGLSTTTNLAFDNAAPTLGDFEIISDNVLLAVVPISATSGPLSAGTSSGTAASAANFLVAPVITSLAPQTGGVGAQLYISGANFIVGGTSVTFSGVTTPVNGTVTSLSVVSATVPQGAVNGSITVTTSAGTAVSPNNFIVSSAPLITDFSPTAAGAGANVVIDGANFASGTTVQFNGVLANSVTVSSATQLTVKVPSGVTTGPIKVSTLNGSFTTSSNFVAANGAIITAFSPTFGITGTLVEIDGVNLYPETKVTFNGVAASVNGYGAGYLQVTVPTNSGIGPLEVFTSGGNFTTSTNFTNFAGPAITSFSPALAQAGATVVIEGVNFVKGDTVKFGNTSAAVTVVASTEISTTVPSGAATGPITVANGSTSFVTSSNFVVTTAAPVITSFTPASGVRGGIITINGGNFTNLSSVRFNGVSANYLPPTSTTVLYAIVPGAATSGLITVNNNSGGGSSPSIFYLQPWITNISPSSIVNSPLVIVGRNLTNATSVVVSGVSYPFTNSPTRIVAIVPTNATSGLVTVTTPGGVIISTNEFLVLPKIYSFSPTIGAAGAIVTIDGTSLFGVTSVQFNGVSATPFNVTTNQLQVAVPPAALTGPITVVSPSGSDVSSNIFTATKPSLALLTKTVTPAIAGPGTNVTYTLLVTNEGPSIITDVTLTDNIPSQLTFISGGSSQGTTTNINGVLIATLGILTNNTSATVTVRTVAAFVGGVTNTAYLGFAEGNLNGNNDFAYAIADFVTSAQLTLSIAAEAHPPGIVVSWPVSAVHFQLQSNTNLSQSNGWETLEFTPFVTHGLNEYTNSLSGTGAFFRLHSP
ncbi:MAG TPA: IPT/TIG domain-containing protein [Candidatus Saccharimonadales bacterium]|nr:IPT/TIG domain-containing protein [Candidatus Saccharimonadales bacterium]